MSKVYLVGAGPGDPDLITVRGRDVLGLADCVLFDHLANEALLDLAPPGAERLYVGKKKSEHAFSQEEIRGLLVERARRGLTVVRLKGGDPFLFGRGGEEAEALADAGIEFEVVPGVTSPLGIAAYCGVPLTHREHTSVVTFVTGHEAGIIDWDRVGLAETLVIFMGLTSIRRIAGEILARGRAPETPAIAVRWATRPFQETVAGTLADIAARVEAYGLKPPATIVIGEVARLREKLDWYGKLPLRGQRILVTRAAGQAGELSRRLGALGAEALELPVIELRPPQDPRPLAAAIARLGVYDWIVFTSVNGVRFFLERLDGSPSDLRDLRARICAIGPATARALRALHLKVDCVPEQFVAESLVAAFAHVDLRGKRVLLPRAAAARDLIPESLRARGASVDVAETYRNVAPERLGERARDLFAGARKPHWVTFTSSSTVKNLFAVLETRWLEGVRIASIGPVTSAALRELGCAVDVEAKVFTIPGLAEAIAGAQRRELPNP